MHQYRKAYRAAVLEQEAKRAAEGIVPTLHREQRPPAAHSREGERLPDSTLLLMQQRFAHDFSRVRVHSGNDAAGAAEAMSARAFTSGNDVFFGAGEYQPQTAPGQRLIAHELTHVVQQRVSPDAPAVQRDDKEKGKDKPDAGSGAPKAKAWKGAATKCGPDFCTPFKTEKEAIDDRDSFFGWKAIRVGVGAAVNTRVLPVWDMWASGGAASVQDFTKVFGADFSSSTTTATTTKTLIDSLKAKLTASPPTVPKGGSVSLDVPTLIPTETAGVDVTGSSTEMNYNVPGEIPGNLAGGIGKDEKANPVGAKPSPQDDERIVKGSVVVSDSGSALSAAPALNYTVKDTVDLCPGDCGAAAETIATIPMSRWEATGIAGDVPYKVDFAPPSISSFTIPKTAAPAPAPTGPTPAPTPKEEPKEDKPKNGR